MNRPGATLYWIPLAVVALTAVTYLPALKGAFVYDDPTQIELGWPHFTWQSVPGYFRGDVWSHLSHHTNYYRPVFLLWLMLNYQILGLDPMLWHASTLAVHLAATFLLYCLARRLSGDPLLAGTAALLFGVHPVHVEGVAWISGVTEPLLAALSFGAVLCDLRSRALDQALPRRVWRIASCCLFACAVFEKETAIVLPALLFAYAWLFSGSPAVRPARRALKAAAPVIPYLAITLVYLVARIAAMGQVAPQSSAWPVAAMVNTWPHLLLFYLRQLVWPVRYSLFYMMTPVLRPGLLEWWLPCLLIAALMAALYAFSRRSRLVAWSSLLAVLYLLPVLDLSAFSAEDFVHDRYLYVPSAGFCLLVALGLRRLSLRAHAAILLPATALLAFLTLHGIRYWKDNLTLFKHALEVAPQSIAAQASMGAILLRENRYGEALPLLLAGLTAHRGHPESFREFIEVGVCYLGLGELDQAAAYLGDGIARNPDYPHGYLYLGLVELQRGRLTEAEGDMRKALELRGRGSVKYERYHYYLGTVLEQKGDLQGAVAEYEAELTENPQEDDVLERQLSVRARLGHPPD